LRYTDQAGQVVLEEGPAVAAGVREDQSRGSIFFLTQWQAGRWLPQPQLSGLLESLDFLCLPGNPYDELLQQRLNATPIGHNFGWLSPVATPELGCLYAGSQTDPATGHFVGPVTLLLYRAGALVTAKAQAIKLFPSLPVASAHERALAQAVAPTSLG
jgi:hypothetical protein